MTHQHTIAALARQRLASTVEHPTRRPRSEPDQVRLIGVDRRGATALCVHGTVGTTLRIPFRRQVHTIDEAIQVLSELARANL